MRFTQGSVTKSAKHWRLVLDAVDGDGTRRRLTKMSAVPVKNGSNAGRRDALTALRRWRDELEREEEGRRAEEEAATDAAGTSLGDYAAAYLDAHRLRIDGATYRGYATSLRSLQASDLGAKPLGEVTAKDVAAYDDELFGRGLGGVTVRKRHSFVAQVFRRAAALGDVPANPCAAVKAPAAPLKPVNALDQASAREVMAHLEAMGAANTIAIAGRLALLTGMRRGEACGMRWLDWDEGAGVLRIGSALGQDYESGYVLKDVKDTSGRGAAREVPVSTPLAQLLAQVRDVQRAACARLGVRWAPTHYVLGDPLGGHLAPEQITHKWTVLSSSMGWLGTQGRPVTYHDLRHTFATVALAEGADVMSLAAILGHKDPSMTMRVYAIALAGPKRQTMAQIGDFYGDGA